MPLTPQQRKTLISVAAAGLLSGCGHDARPPLSEPREDSATPGSYDTGTPSPAAATWGSGSTAYPELPGPGAPEPEEELADAPSKGAEPSSPAVEMGTETGSDCCKGLNECRGKGSCAVAKSHDCAGKNECKGRGGCRGHCPG